MSQDEGQGSFLSRWSRRKAQVQQGGAAVPNSAATASAASAQSPAMLEREQATTQGPASSAVSALSASSSASASMPSTSTSMDAKTQEVRSDAGSSAVPVAEAAPRPTLQDVDQLDAQSDYRHFVARDVDPEVRNAAFKKLFHSDPHFNVMDGLDVYIDDYNTPNPLPVAIMKTLVQARALGLIDDELKEQEPPAAGPEGPADPSDAAAVQGVPPASDAAAEGPHELSGAQSQMLPPAQGVPPGGDLPEPEPVMVECVLVPDRASNDEPIGVRTSAPESPLVSEPVPAAATGEGTVVPFPRRPGTADPA